MNIVYKKINEIRPYENNPRNNEDAIKYVAKSIEEYGFKVPIVIDKDGIIVTGHTRYEASKQLGLKEVPCIIADDLDEEQVKAFRLVDNKVAEQSRWDYKKLMEELKIVDEEMMDFFNIENIYFVTDEVKDEVKEEVEKEDVYYKCPNCDRNILESDLIIWK